MNLIAAEPDVARVPIMIDSSKWGCHRSRLKCIQGKGIVNSISLKEGKDKFVEQARLLRRYGAAVIVMAFDEASQADTYARKIEICEKAIASWWTKWAFRQKTSSLTPMCLPWPPASTNTPATPGLYRSHRLD